MKSPHITHMWLTGLQVWTSTNAISRGNEHHQVYVCVYVRRILHEHNGTMPMVQWSNKLNSINTKNCYLIWILLGIFIGHRFEGQQAGDKQLYNQNYTFKYIDCIWSEFDQVRSKHSYKSNQRCFQLNISFQNTTKYELTNWKAIWKPNIRK